MPTTPKNGNDRQGSVDPALYTAAEAELLGKLGTSAAGLTAEQAAAKLEEFGPNSVASGGRQSFLADILHRCKNPLVIQLLIIAIVCYITGDPTSAGVVGGMVCLSVFLSYFQESRSSRAVEKLQKMVKTTVTVIRDGKEVGYPPRRTCPGDVVVLAAGSLIPADLRVLNDEGLLREPVGPDRRVHAGREDRRPEPAGRPRPFEFTNACFMGSNVLSGSARAVVLATGAAPSSARSPRRCFPSAPRRASTRACAASRGS